MSGEERFTPCTICEKNIAPAERELTNIGFLEITEATFNIKIDKTKASSFCICRQCRKDISNSWSLRNKCMSHANVSNQLQEYRNASVQTDAPSNMLIITGLPPETTEARLTEIFSKYGSIREIYLNVRVWHDSFARVTFNHEEDASRAMDLVDQKHLQIHDYGIHSAPLIITQVSEDTTPINALNDDCLRLVFRKVTNVYDKLSLEKVRKGWKKIARQTWCSVTSFDNDFEFDPNYADVEAVLNRCSSCLTSLYLKFDNNPKLVLKLIAEHCSNLDSIRFWFRDTPLSGKHCLPYLKKVIAKSKGLVRLALAGIDEDVNFSFFANLPEGMKEIILFADDYDDELVSTTIDFSKFNVLVALEIIKFDLDEDSLKGIENLINLEHLSLLHSTVHPSNIKKIIHFTKLKYLEIPHCQIDDTTFSRIIQNNHNLRYLDISRNTVITDLSFRHVRRLAHLETLVMNSVQHVTGQSLAPMPHLETLCCNRCPLIKDLDLIIMIYSSPKLHRLEADGSATDQLVFVAYEILKSRGVENRLDVSGDDELYKRSSNFSCNQRYVHVYPCNDSVASVSPSDRADWYSN